MSTSIYRNTKSKMNGLAISKKTTKKNKSQNILSDIG
jgi:hypothetical protein